MNRPNTNFSHHVAHDEQLVRLDIMDVQGPLNEELETLNAQAREMEATIAKNVAEILES